MKNTIEMQDYQCVCQNDAYFGIIKQDIIWFFWPDKAHYFCFSKWDNAHSGQKVGYSFSR